HRIVQHDVPRLDWPVVYHLCAADHWTIHQRSRGRSFRRERAAAVQLREYFVLVWHGDHGGLQRRWRHGDAHYPQPDLFLAVPDSTGVGARVPQWTWTERRLRRSAGFRFVARGAGRCAVPQGHMETGDSLRCLTLASPSRNPTRGLISRKNARSWPGFALASR